MLYYYKIKFISWRLLFMKKLFYCLGVVVFILLIVICFKFFSFGTQIYNGDNFELKVPFYSKIFDTTKSNDEYVLTFRTFLSKSAILNKTNNILNEYEKYTCQNNVFYYDKENDITIKEIEIVNKPFINEYSITISNGKFDNDFCSIVLNYKNLKH